MLRNFSIRTSIAYGHDIVMAALSFILSLQLRLGDSLQFYLSDRMVQMGVLFTVVSTVVFWFSGLYRGIWRYASITDLWAITRAVSLAILIFLALSFVWDRGETLPRSIFIINWFVLMALLGGPRFIFRLIKDRTRSVQFDANSTGDHIPVLLVGADDGAEMFLRSLRQSGDSPFRAVGIVSERENRVGRELHGISVLDTWHNLDAVIKNLEKQGRKPQKLILTRDNFDGAQVRLLLEQADALGLTLSRLPKMTDLKSGIADSSQITPIDVEDLLGRAQTPLDRGAMANLIEGKRVLITGAGGSIGSELVRQIVSLSPGAITLLDASEYNLYSIDQEVFEKAPDLPRQAVIADVRDGVRIEALLQQLKPDLVFHAAALKHVPLVEDNIFEGIRTNTLGTTNVARASVKAGVQVFVMVSTDKAVNPTSIMGASKRIAEQYIQALDLDPISRQSTRFVTVRFGNVLGSTGSVVPLFQRQLAAGGPITVTHPEMTRYFMTIRESVELILQASALGDQDQPEGGRIYVLDMGEPVKIDNLARQLIQLAGLRPDEDIQITYTGIRPGEKLYEEVFHGGETTVATNAPGILLAAPRTVGLESINKAITELTEICDASETEALHRLIRQLVPEFIET